MEVSIKEYSISIYNYIGRELLNKYGIAMSYTQEEITSLLIGKVEAYLFENKPLISEIEGLNISISLRDDIYKEDIDTTGSVSLYLLSDYLNIELSSHLLRDIVFTEIGVESNTERIEATIAHELVHLMDSNALLYRYENRNNFEDESIKTLAVILSLYRDEGIPTLYEYLLGYIDISPKNNFSEMYSAISTFVMYNKLYDELTEAGKDMMSKMFDYVRYFSYIFGPIMVIEGLYHLTDNEEIENLLLKFIDNIKENKKEKFDKETAASIVKEAIKYGPYEYFSSTFLYEGGTLFNYDDEGGRGDFSHLIYYFKNNLVELWEERQETNIFLKYRKNKEEADERIEAEKIAAETLAEKDKIEAPVKTAIIEETDRLRQIADKKFKYRFTKKERKSLRQKSNGEIPEGWETVLDGDWELKRDYKAAVDKAYKAAKKQIEVILFGPLLLMALLGLFGIIYGIIKESFLITVIGTVMLGIASGFLTHENFFAIVIIFGSPILYNIIRFIVNTFF